MIRAKDLVYPNTGWNPHFPSPSTDVFSIIYAFASYTNLRKYNCVGLYLYYLFVCSVMNARQVFNNYDPTPALLLLLFWENLCNKFPRKGLNLLCIKSRSKVGCKFLNLAFCGARSICLNKSVCLLVCFLLFVFVMFLKKGFLFLVLELAL